MAGMGGFIGLASVYPGMVQGEQQAAQHDLNRMRLLAQVARAQQAQALQPYREARMRQLLAGGLGGHRGRGSGAGDIPLPPLLGGQPMPQAGPRPGPPPGGPSAMSTMQTPFGPQPLGLPAPVAAGLPPGGSTRAAPPPAAPAPQTPAGGGTYTADQVQEAIQQRRNRLAFGQLSPKERKRIEKEVASLDKLRPRAAGGQRSARPMSESQMARQEAHADTDTAVRQEIDAGREATEGQALQMIQAGDHAGAKNFIVNAQKEEQKRLKAASLGATPKLRSTLLTEHRAYYDKLLAALQPPKRGKRPQSPALTTPAEAQPATSGLPAGWSVQVR